MLLAPDFSFNSVLDLKGQAVQVPKNCCRLEAEQLSRLGITLVSEDRDVARALDRLRKKEIKALIQPEPLSTDMACAIMKAEGFPRIYQYDRDVEAHLGEAVRISRTPCAGGEAAVPGRYLCRPCPFIDSLRIPA